MVDLALLNLFSVSESVAMEPHLQIPVAGIVALVAVFFLGALLATKLSIRLGLPAILGVLLLGIMVNIPLFDSLLSETMVEVLHASSLSLLSNNLLNSLLPSHLTNNANNTNNQNQDQQPVPQFSARR